jgi:pumilio RNA-binding family
VTELADIAVNLFGLNLTTAKHTDEDSHLQSLLQLDIGNQPNFVFNVANGHKQSLQQTFTDTSSAGKHSMTTNYSDLARKNGVVTNLNASKITSNGQVNLPKRTSFASLYSEVNSSGFGSSEGSNFHQSTSIPILDFSSHVTGAYPVNEKFNPVMPNHLDAGPFLLFLLESFHATFSSTLKFN